MIRLRRDHYRMLGNGLCARPEPLDCAFVSVCESCTYFRPAIEFRPTLQRQHDGATAKHQTCRRRKIASAGIRSSPVKIHDDVERRRPSMHSLQLRRVVVTRWGSGAAYELFGLTWAGLPAVSIYAEGGESVRVPRVLA